MPPERSRSRIRAGLLEGKGWSLAALAALPPASRDRLILEVLATPSSELRLAEPRRGAFHARCVRDAGSPGLPQKVLELAEGRLRGTEEGHHALWVLAELVAAGAPLPPLPFIRLVESEEDFFWKLPAIRVLALQGDPEVLPLVVEAAARAAEDPFDAKDLGEALALARPGADPILRDLLRDERPLVRLAAAFGLVATDETDAPVTDATRETVADLMAFDPDPTVRVHALEVREASRLDDPHGVVLRILTDPTLHGFMDSWHWSFAAEELPTRDLPAALRSLEASREVSAEEIAEILAESTHPLAGSLLRSRLFTGSDEDRAAYLKALELCALEVDDEVLAAFDPHAPPPRVLVLRARRGDRDALAAVFQGILAGDLGPFDMDGGRDDLVLSALLPEAIKALADAEPEVRARLMAVFRPLIPREHLPAPDPSHLESSSARVVTQATLDALEHAEGDGLAPLARLLRAGPPETRVAALEACATRAGAAERLVLPLAEDPDGHVRRLVLRTLAAGALGADAREVVLARLEDPEGALRAEALQAARQRGLPLPRADVEAMLADSLDDVRAEAARYLATAVGKPARAVLEAALRAETMPWVANLIEEQLDRLGEVPGETREMR